MEAGFRDFSFGVSFLATESVSLEAFKQENGRFGRSFPIFPGNRGANGISPESEIRVHSGGFHRKF
jgi:hypothetical protein